MCGTHTAHTPSPAQWGYTGLGRIWFDNGFGGGYGSGGWGGRYFGGKSEDVSERGPRAFLPAQRPGRSVRTPPGGPQTPCPRRRERCAP